LRSRSPDFGAVKTNSDVFVYISNKRSGKGSGMFKWYVVQVLSTREKGQKSLEEHLELKGMADQFKRSFSD